MMFLKQKHSNNMPTGVYKRSNNISEVSRRNALCRKTSNKGMKYNISEESHKRMSEAKIGHTPWNKWKVGCYTKEQILKMSISQKKKVVPIEVRIKISNSTKRENGNNWKGGLTDKYHIIRNCMEYKLWRKSVFERDNYCCRMCGDHNYDGRGESIYIHAHHLKSFANFPELRFSIDNEITLCLDCHKEVHRVKNS